MPSFFLKTNMPPQHEPQSSSSEELPIQSMERKESSISSTQAQNPGEWKLEESSLWWLSLDFFQNPGNILLLSSLPLCAGAYYGYMQPGDKLEEWVGDRHEPRSAAGKTSSSQQMPSVSTSTSNANNIRTASRALEREAEIMGARQLGMQTAARALGLATLGTCGAFGLLGAAGFYLAGFRSMDEALWRTRQWASSNRESLEDWLGMEDRESKTHPDVIATKNMTEDEEINFVYNQLMTEVENENKNKSNSRKS